MTANRVAIVTAASRGMGAAIARRLAADGWRLALMSRSDDVLALAEELGAVGRTGSVASANDLARFVDAAMDAYGRIDAAICNSGHAPKGELLGISDEEWRAGMDILLMNTIRMAGLVTPVMERQGAAPSSTSRRSRRWSRRSTFPSRRWRGRGSVPS